MGFQLGRLAATALFAAFLACSARPAVAQDAHPEGRAATTGKFLAGAGAAFVLHEGGHLLFDGLFDARPYVKRVDFAGIPFFAITHRSDMTPRREFAIDAAGFWVQEGTTEWLLSRTPALRSRHSPVVKGMVAFNVLASVAYSVAAFAKIGPGERDTRGMADAAGISERAVGVIVLAPAILDAYRYFHPDSSWARWTSRGAKLAGVAIILK